jgi:hypothetical protein
MITATRIDLSHTAGPQGNPGIKGVMIELREGDNKPFVTETVSLAAGDAASEKAQLDRAVPKLIEGAGKAGPWRWAN